MGVYIKGMEMPKSCYDCNCFIRDSDGSDYCCLLMQDIEDNDKRDDNCPLVPVPPHGRLIDADALIDSFDPSDFWNPDAEDNCFAAIHVVNCAPTIIPEEEE